jgi:hypothetical protein
MLAPDTVVDWSTEPDVPALKHAYALFKQDKAAAMPVLEGLAQKGSLMAMIYLGGQYSGSVPENCRDIERAIFWYKMAFDRGAVFASYYLGDAYLRANKYVDAMRTLEWGAERKFVLAMWLLGLVYYQGIAIPKNLFKTKSMWEAAAALGHVRSKRSLALLYMRRQFGLQNVLKGMLLFLEALWDAIQIARRNPNSDLLKG